MRRFLSVLVLAAILATGGQAVACSSLVLNNTPCEVYFSPDGGAQDAIVREIGKARSSILVQAFSFTSAPIAKALIEAKKRGVAIAAILDKSQRTERYTGATFLKNEGISVMIDAAHAIAHNKVIVIDSGVVITGSFNFTKSAEERNAENLLVIRSPELAKIYSANWAEHKKHSEAY
jgi:phosphatidylserine/phosphatidylglycerophosphate/cardiolipin synthase-like enzyme